MYLHKIFDRLHEAASLNHTLEDPIRHALNLIIENRRNSGDRRNSDFWYYDRPERRK